MQYRASYKTAVSASIGSVPARTDLDRHKNDSTRDKKLDMDYCRREFRAFLEKLHIVPYYMKRVRNVVVSTNNTRWKTRLG